MKYIMFLGLLLFLFISAISNAQILNLPARSAAALSGSDFVATIASPSLSLTNRENLIYTQIESGNVPNFMRGLIAITSTATINSVQRSVTYYVLPDYLAIGSDSDYFLCPMSPMLATKIADLTDCTLPTRKMVNAIWNNATVKLAPSTITPTSAMTTVPVFQDHNETVFGQRSAELTNHPLGELVAGNKKDVVVSNQIYSTSNRVVIYGWHQLNGSPIQPLSSVHADTYMDYSHGIRLIQNAAILDGSTPTTVKDILKSSTLNSLLSDEGVMSNPQYPYTSTVTPIYLNKPISFSIAYNTTNSLKFIISIDEDVTHYKVYKSIDGNSFDPYVKLKKTNLVLENLNANQIYFIKIEAYDSITNSTSLVSEVLAATTIQNNDSILIVNGFDRATAGNTFNYSIQHGNAVFNSGNSFESATNEAVSNGLINLSNYKIVDYILGEESTANETFSSNEQSLVSEFLNNGGRLFVSGAEIGWDLFEKGSASDQVFFNSYLKASYLLDAPNNTASSCYNVNNIFNMDSIGLNCNLDFDDGTNGTYNVKYPDVLDTLNGSKGFVNYEVNGNPIAGIYFYGKASNSSANQCKLVYLGYPFETIVDENSRDLFMKQILSFFKTEDDLTSTRQLTSSFDVFYPNPTNGLVNFSNQNELACNIIVHDVLGKEVYRTQTNESKIDISFLEGGMYTILLISDNGKQVQKILLSKD